MSSAADVENAENRLSSRCTEYVFPDVLRCIARKQFAMRLIAIAVGVVVVKLLLVILYSYVAAAGGHEQNAVARLTVEREFGVNIHFTEHYFNAVSHNGYRCSETHPYVLRKRAALCVPDSVEDVRSVRVKQLRWMPPHSLYFKGANHVSLPDKSRKDLAKEAEWRTALYCSGVAYCRASRGDRVKQASFEGVSRVCLDVMRCDYVGEPLKWDERPLQQHFRCTPVSKTATDHGMRNSMSLAKVAHHVTVLCRNRENASEHYSAPDVHSDYNECTLTYEHSGD